MHIKDFPELRHCLAHLFLAIEETALGHKKAALYELAQVKRVVMFKTDGEYRRYAERFVMAAKKKAAKHKPKGKRKPMKPCRGK